MEGRLEDLHIKRLTIGELNVQMRRDLEEL
jgi:hypothetical protein